MIRKGLRHKSFNPFLLLKMSLCLIILRQNKLWVKFVHVHRGILCKTFYKLLRECKL